jgi:hypothetical protein
MSEQKEPGETRGRKRRSQTGASVYRLGVRLSPYEHELLERIRAHFGEQHTSSEVVRSLIVRLGETLPPTPKP